MAAESQTIPAGYHNGSGTVAGDADLVAGNIVNGVNTFGIMGTALAGGQCLKTGQTTCYDTSGTVIACAGTGRDGDKGLATSYVDNGDGTITDTNTGLMWEKLDKSGSIHAHGLALRNARALGARVEPLERRELDRERRIDLSLTRTTG